MPTEVQFGEGSCASAEFRGSWLDAEELWKQARVPYDEAGFSGDRVRVVDVTCEDRKWEGPWSVFFLKTNDILYMPWDGIFFEMTRVSCPRCPQGPEPSNL